MFGRARAVLPLLLAALLLTGGAAMAQTFGRVVIIAKDTDGKPIQGVKITVTCDSLPQFRQEKETNKKGKATISVIDATHVYQFKMEYNDYPSFEVPIKPTLRTTITREITIGETEDAPSQGGGEVTYTLSERIFNEGVTALREGNLTTAKEKFLEALDNNPSMHAARSALAGIYLEEGDFAKAIEEAKVVVDVQPDQPRGYYMLYDAYQGAGNQAAADEALAQLKELDTSGDAAAMIFNDGVAAYQLGDYKRARSRFEEALEMKPDLEAAENALARIYLLQKSFPEAAAISEKLLARNPSDKAAMKIRYDAYNALGDTAKAKEAFQALAAVEPTVLAKTLFDEGNVLFQGGDMESAIGKLTQVVELQPDHGKAHYLLGLCYVNKDDKGKAKEHLQKFVEIAPNDPDIAAAKSMIEYL